MLVTNTEIDKMKRLFFQLDLNQDGYISVDEFQAGLSKVVGALQMTSAEIKDLMKHMDANGDGKIDYQEFTAALIQRDVAL